MIFHVYGNSFKKNFVLNDRTEKCNWRLELNKKKRTLTFRNEAISLDSFKFSSIFSGEYKRHLYTLADYHKPVGYKKKRTK